MLFFDERFAPCEALLDGEKERCGIRAPTNSRTYCKTDDGYQDVWFCKHHKEAYKRLSRRRLQERRLEKLRTLRVMDGNEVHAMTPQEIC